MRTDVDGSAKVVKRKDKNKKDKKKRKENKDRDRSDDRRSPPSPVRGTQRSQRLQSISQSPPPHRRPRERTRSPSPPARSHEWVNERQQEPRPARQTPSGGSPPAILKRLRFRGADTDAGPPASRHRDRGRDRGQDQKPAIDLRQRHANVREPEAQARPQVRPHIQATAAVAFVPEEQFWKQRRGTRSPTRRSEGPPEDSGRSEEHVMTKAGSSVLSRLTFLGSPPQKRQMERTSSYEKEPSRPHRADDGRLESLRSRRAVKVTRASSGTEISDRGPSGRVKVTFRGKNQDEHEGDKPVGSRTRRIEFHEPSTHTRAHSSDERDLRHSGPNEGAELDAPEGGTSPQHFDSGLDAEASPDPYLRSAPPQRRTHGDPHGMPGQPQESRKRSRIERQETCSDGMHDHALEDPLPPNRGRDVYDDGYWGEEPSPGSRHRDAEGDSAAPKSQKSRDFNEKEKCGKDKLRHKDSKKRKKEARRDYTPPREHVIEEGEDVSTHLGRHARAEYTGPDDAVQDADAGEWPVEGTEKRSKALEEEGERPLSRQQSPAAAEQGHERLPEGDDAPRRRSERARSRKASSPLPPPPQVGPPRIRGATRAAHSPALGSRHAHPSPNKRGDQRGGVRGQSRPTAQPPNSAPVVGGVESQGSPVRRRMHATGGGPQDSRYECSTSPKPPPPGPPPPPPARQHRPVPPPGPPPPGSPLAHLSQGPQRHDGAGQFMKRWGRRAPGEQTQSTNDAGESDRPNRGANWIRTADQRTHEQGGGVAMGEDHANQNQQQRSTAGSNAQDRGDEGKNRQDRVRWPLPLVLPGFAVVGGVGRGRTMPGAMDVWRKVLARELKVPTGEDSVVGAAVRSLLRQDDENGTQAGSGSRTDKSEGSGTAGLGSANTDGRWSMYQGALRRGIDPAAWIEAQPKLRVAGASDISDEAWRKKVQSCTNTVFRCSELLKVMKLRRESALRPAEAVVGKQG